MIRCCIRNKNSKTNIFLVPYSRFLTSTVAKEETTLVGDHSLPSFRTQISLAKTLYRQILKWTVRTGSQVPFDPMPPLTLVPPRVDATTLRLLSLEIQNIHVWDEGIYSSASDDSDVSAFNMDDVRKEIRFIAKQMPINTIVREHQITVPMHNADDIRKATRMIYKLNSIGPQSRLDLDCIKDRVNLGFEVFKSLNQLSELLDGRKLSREKHMDRLGVKFHVGQVVQHKTKRWRAIVAGWEKNIHEAQSEQNTSLTQKDYKFGAHRDDDDMNEMEIQMQVQTLPESNHSPEVVEYILHLDQGDAAFSRTRVLGSTKVKEKELDLVVDNDLKRVRNSLVKHQFTGFDNINMEFIPGKVLQYEYPVETTSDIQQDSHDVCKETKYDLDKHENAKVVLDGVKTIASQLHRIILDTSSCAEARNIPILYELERKIQEIVDQEQGYESSDAMSSHKLAIKCLNRFIGLASEVNSVMWQRNRAKENKDRVHFPLGSVVRHKKYGFRGGTFQLPT